MAEAKAETQPPVEPYSGMALGFELPPKRTVSQWADARRMIAAGTGPEPGRWRTDRVPFLREPMDAFNDLANDVIVLKWSSQVGKTEVLINVSGFFIDQDPAPQMFVLPTLELGDSFSTKRFSPTVDATPSLLDKIGGSSSRDASITIREKAYPGGDIVFAGANSAASLASRPRRVVLFDEIDKYKASIGNDGDPIRQGFQRTTNFWNARKGLASTPSLEGMSAIDHWYKRSDQRLYMVPCHECGTKQPLEWETERENGKERRITWKKGQPETAVYSCAECGVVWDQRQVHLAVQHGAWVATAPHNGIAGFHVNSIASPWVTMEQLAREWEDAEGKPQEEQTFYNLKLGLSYNPTKEAETTPETLFNHRREDFGVDKLPNGVLLITAGVDVQSNRFEVQYVGWGEGEEQWIADHVVHPCDPSDPKAWDELDAKFLSRSFTHPSGREMWVEAACIDSGYFSQKVYDFCRLARASFKNYYAIKGVAGQGRPIFKESPEKLKGGGKLHIVGVDDAKTTFYIEIGRTEPVRVHFAGHLALSFFTQLVSERVKVDFKAGLPVRQWVLPPGKRNEALDAHIYATAARYSMSIDYVQRRADMEAGGPKVPDYGKLADLFK